MAVVYCCVIFVDTCTALLFGSQGQPCEQPVLSKLYCACACCCHGSESMEDTIRMLVTLGASVLQPTFASLLHHSWGCCACQRAYMLQPHTAKQQGKSATCCQEKPCNFTLCMPPSCVVVHCAAAAIAVQPYHLHPDTTAQQMEGHAACKPCPDLSGESTLPRCWRESSQGLTSRVGSL